jgi:Tat protein secretion system quality control protein TatD with DNase activity
MLFDTHSHCYFGELLPDIENVFLRMQEYGITRNVQIGCDITSSLAAIHLARTFPGTYASV